MVDGIHWGSVGPLLLISLAIMGSPGPATISLMAAGAAYGVRRSLSYLIGIIVGTTIVLLAVSSTFSVAGGTFLGIANPEAWVAIAAVFASGHLANDTTTDATAKRVCGAGRL